MNQLQFENEISMEIAFHADGISREELQLIIEQGEYMSDHERKIFFNALIKLMKAYH
jgi:hypothetical protein